MKKLKVFLIISNILILISIILISFLSFKLKEKEKQIILYQDEIDQLKKTISKLQTQLYEESLPKYLQNNYPNPKIEDFENIENDLNNIFDKLNQENPFWNKFDIKIIPQNTNKYAKINTFKYINGKKIEFDLNITNNKLYGYISSNDNEMINIIKNNLQNYGAKVIEKNENKIYFEATKNIKKILEFLGINR